MVGVEGNTNLLYPVNKCFIIHVLLYQGDYNIMDTHPYLLAMFAVVVCGFLDFMLALEKSRDFLMYITVFPPMNQKQFSRKYITSPVRGDE